MVIKVYISGISGNKEVKKRQQRVLLILDSKNVEYTVIDIAEPGAEEAKDFVQNNSTAKGATISDPDPRHPLPPQIYNEEAYCGDYDMFDMANEIDEMEKFLKLKAKETTEETSTAEIKLKNGDVANDEKPEEPKEEESKENEVPNEQEETEESKENGSGDATKLESGNDNEAADDKQAEEGEEEEEEKPKSKEPSPEKTEEKSKEPSPEKTEEKSKESSPDKADD